MITFSINDLTTLLSIVVAFAALLSVFMGFYTQRRSTRYDEEKHRVELEIMRQSIETQMLALNEKLLATENRWKDVNHLLISSQNRQSEENDFPSEVVASEFLRSAGLRPPDLIVSKDLVFVLTPFHPTYKKQFAFIASACNSLGLRAIRGDEDYVTGEVFPHILRQIAKARIVIALIDGRNPNVFYELGIAHTLGKTTILVASTPEEVPFDIRTKRLVLFKSMDELQAKIKDELARAVLKEEKS